MSGSGYGGCLVSGAGAGGGLGSGGPWRSRVQGWVVSGAGGGGRHGGPGVQGFRSYPECPGGGVHGEQVGAGPSSASPEGALLNTGRAVLHGG